MPQLFANNAVTLLGDSVLATDTNIRVLSGTGQLFPLPQRPEDYFLITLENQNATVREILKVTARNGDVFQVERGQENSIPLLWGQQTLVDLRETAGTITRLQQVVNDIVTISIGDDGFLRIYATEQFAPRSTQLWVGGLRQCLGTDYIEEYPSILKILYPISQSDLENGMNIVLDFYRK
jgi:hypothetical protein